MGMREPVVVRELERCIALRFQQFLESVRQSATDGPIEWAKAEVIEVLQYLPEYPSLQQLIERVVDEEILRRPAPAPAGAASALADAAPAEIARAGEREKSPYQQAMLALAGLWDAHPDADAVTISRYAQNIPTPWKDCTTWDDAIVHKEAAWKTLLSKSRKVSKNRSL